MEALILSISDNNLDELSLNPFHFLSFYLRICANGDWFPNKQNVIIPLFQITEF